MIVLCDNEEQATDNCYEKSAKYVFVKSNISQYKVSSNYTTVPPHGLFCNSQSYTLKYIEIYMYSNTNDK